MPATLVVQSHRQELPFDWLQPCLDSVAGWARDNGFDYRFVGDELFDLLAPELRQKIGDRCVIASDLARLGLLQQGLAQGYARVVWCDADFLIFDAENFALPDEAFCFGREVWVQNDARGRLRVYSKLHNACMMFRQGNSCLDFYAATAARLLWSNQGRMSPQFIGPKLLTALHNIACFPVFERAGMLSPLVMRDLLEGGGAALELFLRESPQIPAGVNLSSSLTAAEGFTSGEMTGLINRLRSRGLA